MKNGFRPLSVLEKNSKGLRAVLHCISDYAAIVSAVLLAVCLRNAWVDYNVISVRGIYTFLWVPAVYMIGLGTAGLYQRQLPFWQAIERIFYASVYSVGFMIILLYVGHVGQTTSRLFAGLFAVLSFLFIVLFRYAAKRISQGCPYLQIPLLVIGAGKTAELFVESLKREGGMGYRILGFLEDGPVKSPRLKDYPVLGRFCDAEDVIDRTRVSNVCIAAPGMEQKKMAELVYRVQPLVHHLAIIPNLIDIPMGTLEVESFFQ